MSHTQTTPAVLTLDETAAFLRLEPERFRRKRRALEARGFPRPLPGLASYARAAVEAYVAGAVASPADGAARRPGRAANDVEIVDDMEASLAYIRAELDARLAEGRA